MGCHYPRVDDDEKKDARGLAADFLVQSSEKAD